MRALPTEQYPNVGPHVPKGEVHAEKPYIPEHVPAPTVEYVEHVVRQADPADAETVSVPSTPRARLRSLSDYGLDEATFALVVDAVTGYGPTKAGHVVNLIQNGAGSAGHDFNPDPVARSVWSVYRKYLVAVNQGRLPRRVEPELAVQQEMEVTNELTDLDAAVLEGTVSKPAAERIRKRESLEDIAAAHKAAVARKEREAQ